jgi:hypothetical protein
MVHKLDIGGLDQYFHVIVASFPALPMATMIYANLQIP